MTSRQKLARIVMHWLKTAKPDNAEAPSDLIDEVMEWAERNQDVREALDEDKLFALISKHNTRNPDRFYDPKAMAEDRQLAIDILEHFRLPDGRDHIVDANKTIDIAECKKIVRKCFEEDLTSVELWSESDAVDVISKAICQHFRAPGMSVDAFSNWIFRHNKNVRSDYQQASIILVREFLEWCDAQGNASPTHMKCPTCQQPFPAYTIHKCKPVESQPTPEKLPDNHICAATYGEGWNDCHDAFTRLSNPSAELEIVICAAIKLADGLIVRGHRHGDCIHNLNRRPDFRNEQYHGHIQGFITSKNRFVTREEGRKLQDAAGIPSAEKDGGYRGDTLFS
jgi:hypothetical protein